MIFTTHSFLHRFWIGFLFAYIFWRLAQCKKSTGIILFSYTMPNFEPDKKYKEKMNKLLALNMINVQKEER